MPKQVPRAALDDLKASGAAKLLLKTAWERLDLSVRDYNIINQIARAIAKLDGSSKVKTEHIAGAVHYRSITGYLDSDIKPLKL